MSFNTKINQRFKKGRGKPNVTTRMSLLNNRQKLP